MPLSRHFYSLDEVKCALPWSIIKKKPLESLFWCKELIDSGCIGECVSILFETWLWHYGPFKSQWLLTHFNALSSDSINEKDIIDSCYALASINTNSDSSLWYIIEGAV
jgi:hypothetical protein